MQNPPYILGLDIGIASVGAALLTDHHILGMHVRTFDAAETAKEGDPLNKIRREARSARRRIRRRAFRLLRLRRLFHSHGLLASTDLEDLPKKINAWQVRSEGLDRVLTNKELVAALYHIVKHRGFQSNRKSEIKADAKAGQMLSGVKENQRLMEEKGYRTVGEMAWKDECFADAKRNKSGTHQHTFERSDLVDELNLLLSKQQELGNNKAIEELQERVHALLMSRRPTIKDDDIEKMLGKCTFEQEEYRAAKAAYSSERFVWLGKLNNLRIIYMGDTRSLTQDERNSLINLPFEQSSLKFHQVRKKLDLQAEARFNLVRYSVSDTLEKAEKSIFFEAKAYQSIKKSYKEAGLVAEWESDKWNTQKLDAIATAISLYRDDDRIRQELSTQCISEPIIEATLHCQFEQFINLSLKALNKILPYMEQGQRYDQACLSAGYHHSKKEIPKVKTGRIPAPDKEKIRNPVVYRSLNQSRKLINAIVKKYGAPKAIHIELARDLSKPFDERKSIEREQEKYRRQKEQRKQDYIDKFGSEPNSLNLLKYTLYREQDCQCAYSQQAIDIVRLNEPGYVEVDHILPYSRSYDDSMLNKTLVLTAVNRDKGNRTPYEYMGEDDQSEQWQYFVAWVQSNPKIRQAKRNRYLRKNFSTDAAKVFKERNLNDTRYIGTELKQIIEEHIIWHSDDQKSEHCTVLSGRVTAILRGRWGFNKARADGDLHHAVDAAVIAACTPSMVQRMARHSKYHELKQIQNSYIDPETGELHNLQAERQLEKNFPLPWNDFKKDVLNFLNPEPINANNLDESINHSGVRVSRAPTRRKLGAAHQETIRSKGKDNQWLNECKSALKTPLIKLKLKDLPDIVGYEDPRNAKLIQAIKARLNEFDGNGAKAFSANQPPLYKPSKAGKKAPIIRSVNLLSTQKSGVSVREGIASNDTMLRVDLFSKNSKFFAVPIYMADAVQKRLPNKAVLANKLEEDWPEMDDTFQFLFTLYPNDWVKLTQKKQTFEGYFAGIHRGTGNISIWSHDRNQRLGKKGLYEGLGIKTALSVQKYHIDILGNLYPVKPEKRQPLNKKQRV